MKKTIVISLIAVFCLAGCSFGKNKTEDAKKTSEDTTLLGQLKNSEGISCVVNTLNGEVNIKAKGDSIRIEGVSYVYDQTATADMTSPQTNLGTMLSVGDEQYIWSGQKGTKFNAKELSKMTGEQTEIETAAKDWQSTIGEWQQAGFNYRCEKENLLDDIFTLPSDVDFTDLNETLRLLQNLNQPTSNDIGSDGIISDLVSDSAGIALPVNIPALTEEGDVENE